MKSLFAHPVTVLAGRILVGLLFILAGAEKMGDTEAFALSIMNYQLSSESVATLLATVLPWVEFLAGLAILTGVYFRGASLIAALSLVLFTGAVATALLRRLDISCGCFTQDPAVGKISWLKVAENSGLFLVTLFLLNSRSDAFTLPSFLKRWHTDPHPPA
ncbi:MAG TPA: MauE/DoxX family redox-associated membrane protein [Bacteroidota bacterium]|nr:MauE/DoxX family redox-associated membrane protein [Bacteroidota bacterium]